MSWCVNITDKALFSLSQYQHQLSSLNLSTILTKLGGCSEITDIGIEWVVTTLKNLEYLNLCTIKLMQLYAKESLTKVFR
jgi:hypothetical protein